MSRPLPGWKRSRSMPGRLLALLLVISSFLVLDSLVLAGPPQGSGTSGLRPLSDSEMENVKGGWRSSSKSQWRSGEEDPDTGRWENDPDRLQQQLRYQEQQFLQESLRAQQPRSPGVIVR